MRHPEQLTELAWPVLGPRYANLRRPRGSEGYFTCDADDRALNQQVTLRVSGQHSREYERTAFEREAEALAAIGDEPGVVRLLATDKYLGAKVLVLQRHRPLVLEPAGLLPSSAVAVAIRLADALIAAHARGFAHGRIEPDNVMIGVREQPLLAGFEARLTDQPAAVQQLSVRIVSGHTPPELLRGEPVTEAADVYGLGSTLFALLAGKAARIERPGLPYELHDLIGQAISDDPSQRPDSVAAFAAELRRIERRQLWQRTALCLGARNQPERRFGVRRSTRHRAG